MVLRDGWERGFLRERKEENAWEGWVFERL